MKPTPPVATGWLGGEGAMTTDTLRDWHPMARCIGYDPEIWFRFTDERLAKRICGKCRVQEQCRAECDRREAFEPHDMTWGVVAGENRDERFTRRSRELGA